MYPARTLVVCEPKAGNSPFECDDAWFVSPPSLQVGISGRAGLRVVLCDGATQGDFSGWWARTIVAAFATAPLRVLQAPDEFAKLALREIRIWPRRLGSYYAQRRASAKPLSWYEEPELELIRPAGTTVVTVQVNWLSTSNAPPDWRLRHYRELPRGTWVATAVGDTNLFHVRGDTLDRAFPLQDAASFDDFPDLITTDNIDAASLSTAVRHAQGYIRQGDSLYICSDALAEWFLLEHAMKNRPWEVLGRLTRGNFGEWLASERYENKIHNDDVTLVRLDC